MLLDAVEGWPEAFRDVLDALEGCPEAFWRTSRGVIEASTCDLARKWLGKAAWSDFWEILEGALGVERQINLSFLTT